MVTWATHVPSASGVDSGRTDSDFLNSRLQTSVFAYFGYGSNLHLPALRAKGVEPMASVRGRLLGWRLSFDVRHWFPHEGGMGNIHRTDNSADEVQGVVHTCNDADLVSLDRMEAYGVGYDRILVDVLTEAGPVRAQAYVGLPAFLDPSRLPTQRYLNILVKGAMAAGLGDEYIRRLREHLITPEVDAPAFEPPAGDFPRFTRASLGASPNATALLGAVFDMSRARHDLESAKPVLGGRDTTLFHLHRHDTSNGTETLDDLRHGRISERARRYLATWLHAYATEFRYAGRYVDD
jgi:sulfite reductase (NADPH) flavoprotein alpha-component